MERRRGRLAIAMATAVLGAALSVRVGVAEQGALEIGAMRIAYDKARWSASGSRSDVLRLVPLGARGERGTLFVERRGLGTSGCDAALRAALPSDHYAASSVTTPIEIAGSTGLRALAHSRCRSAQPRGVAVCVELAGSAYVLVSRKSSCRSEGQSPFSDVDPLAEIIAGVTFAR